VSPSAHLWTMTAVDIANAFHVLPSIPIANPSKMAWIPIANYKIYGINYFDYASITSASSNVLNSVSSSLVRKGW